MLEVRHLSQAYGGIRALVDLNLAIPAQQVYGLIGPGGAGKTTLLDAISGVSPPTAGEILLDGKRLDRRPAHQVAHRGVARTFQPDRLLNESSALHHLLIAQHRRGRGRLWEELTFGTRTRHERNERRSRAWALLRLVRLEHAAHRPAGLLSPDERRRLAIANALAQAPAYLLLDEPAAGATVEQRRALHRLFLEIVQGGVTIVLAAQDASFAFAVCDRVAVLRAGALAVEGLTREVQQAPETAEAYLWDWPGGVSSP